MIARRLIWFSAMTLVLAVYLHKPSIAWAIVVMHAWAKTVCLRLYGAI